MNKRISVLLIAILAIFFTAAFSAAGGQPGDDLLAKTPTHIPVQNAQEVFDYLKTNVTTVAFVTSYKTSSTSLTWISTGYGTVDYRYSLENDGDLLTYVASKTDGIIQSVLANKDSIPGNYFSITAYCTEKEEQGVLFGVNLLIGTTNFTVQKIGSKWTTSLQGKDLKVVPQGNYPVNYAAITSLTLSIFDTNVQKYVYYWDKQSGMQFVKPDLEVVYFDYYWTTVTNKSQNWSFNMPGYYTGTSVSGTNTLIRNFDWTTGDWIKKPITMSIKPVGTDGTMCVTVKAEPGSTVSLEFVEQLGTDSWYPSESKDVPLSGTISFTPPLLTPNGFFRTRYVDISEEVVKQKH